MRYTPRPIQPWPVVPASAQRASRISIVVDEMPAHASMGGVRQGLVVFAVAWSFHERTPYAEGRTLLNRHGGDYWPGSQVDCGNRSVSLPNGRR